MKVHRGEVAQGTQFALPQVLVQPGLSAAPQYKVLSGPPLQQVGSQVSQVGHQLAPMAPPSLGGALIAPQPQTVNQPQQIYNQEESSQARMFTADESGTVTLPLTMPPAASSLTLISNNGSHGPGITAPVSAGLHQSTPLTTGPS